jgi:uncharacterized OB-fold protein
MEKWLEGLEPVVVHQDLKVPYRYSMGATTSKFFIEIRDNQKIMGIRCPQCDVVFVPPRTTCGRCFSQLHEWVDVSNHGTLETFTQVHYATPVQPAVAPFYYGIIKLDGADTGLAHMIGDLKGKEPRIGMRLQAVFQENRKGNMLDIRYFKPIEEEKAERRMAKGPRLKAKEKKAKRGKVQIRVEAGKRAKVEGVKKTKPKAGAARAKAKKAVIPAKPKAKKAKGQKGKMARPKVQGTRGQAKARK